MKHSQKIIIYLVFFTISFVCVQIDLLSQNEILLNKNNLINGGVYRVTLSNGKELKGELQSYDSISISVISNEGVFNIKQEQIKSIEIPKVDYHSESPLKELQNWVPYWAIELSGGGMIPIGEFGDKYNFSGNVGADIIYHINPLWAVYADVTYNFLSYKDQDDLYNWNYYTNGYNSKSSSLLELSIGPRYYIVRKKVSVHGEAGWGYYSLNTSPNYYANTSFGINFGLGASIQLNRKIDLILKTKYHIVFELYRSESSIYDRIHLGINYKF